MFLLGIELGALSANMHRTVCLHRIYIRTSVKASSTNLGGGLFSKKTFIKFAKYLVGYASAWFVVSIF